MNYKALYNYIYDLSQNLNQTAKFFHGRKEILNQTSGYDGLYVYCLPFTSNGSTVGGAQINETWEVNIIFYMLDKPDSAIDQNNQNQMQDEIRTLTITEQSANRFLRLVQVNDINEGLESASDLITIDSFSKSNAIKDTAQMLTGTLLTLNLTVPDNFNYCTFISNEAQLVLDRMSNLTPDQESAIINFVDEEVAAGNWALIEEFWCHALGSVNSLIGFKKTQSTNSGASFDNTGALFTGGHIKTGFTPSTDVLIGGLNNLSEMIYIVENNEVQTGAAYASGVRQGVNSLSMRNQGGSGSIGYTVNSTGAGSHTTGSGFVANTLYASKRDNAATIEIFANGVEVDDENVAVKGLPSLEVYIGAWNYNGTADDPLDFKSGTYGIAAAIGFDHEAHYANVNRLLLDLM